MLKIGEFSKIGQVSPKALRLYDERGLLRPAWIDRFSGYRYYRAEQLARLHSILALKDLGFTLDQIGVMLSGDVGEAELAQVMRRRQRELSRHIAAEEARLRRVEARLQQLEANEELPRYEVVLKPAAAVTVAGLRRTLAGRQELPQLIAGLQQELRRRRLPQPTYLLGLYHDPAFRDEGLDVEVAAPVSGVRALSGALALHDLPGAELMACTVHRGPFVRLTEAYEALHEWLDGSGYRPSGSLRDLFYEAPDGAEPAGQALTEVQIPIQPKPFLSPVAKAKDNDNMEIKIEDRPAFQVVGVPYYGKNENDELAELWETAYRRHEEIGARTGLGYGLCKEADEDGRFRYLAGYGINTAGEVPEGMELWEVPQATYAVFPCRLPAIGEAYAYAFETWLPQSEYRFRGGGMDFELYPQAFDPSTGEEALFIYIPVEEK